MLENESIRKLILNKILVVKQYDGVQTFFDCMLKELVDDDEEWRNKIVQCDLPDGFKKFATNLFTQFLRQLPPLGEFRIDRRKKTIKPYFVNALYFSLANGKGKIFEFFCDCLDATFQRQNVQDAMLNSFDCSMKFNLYFSFTFFCKKEAKLFKRFIDYFDSNSSASNFLSKILFHPGVLPPCDLEYSHWNGEEHRKVVIYFLEFLNNQRDAFENNFGPNRERNSVSMLTFFIFTKNYESHLKQFLGLLSRSKSYSDDSKFANLLKKAFCSKTHFIGGQVEKVLIILRELERQHLLIQLSGTVLAIEPEAFQRFYNPLSLEGEDIRAMELSKLLERDSYRMTSLHRAAFHGDAEGVEKILQKIQNLAQENDTKQLLNVMARDEYGFTPFYMAAARGNGRIFSTLFTFLREQVADVEIEKHSIDLNEVIHCALQNAIELENVEMLKLILMTIKREKGQNDLIGLLKTNRKTLPESSSHSFFVKCKTNELFNAMAKIVVMKDDNVVDYTNLYDLIFHDEDTTRTLQYIDIENLQGLLSLKGVDDFTKRVLNCSSYLLSNAFRLMSNHLLKNFTEDQRKQFVETITSKNNTTKIKSMNSTSVSSAWIEDFTFPFIAEVWTKEDLVFKDEGNGIITICAERIVPICYWNKFIGSALTAHYDDRGFVSREDVHCIFDCLKHAGDDSAKKLLLHEEDNVSTMIRSSQMIVKLMLTHLSKESQEEVKEEWKNNAPPMNTFFALTSESNRIRFARYYSDILRFYLNYGSDNHLKEFVNVVTDIHKIDDVQEFNVWSSVFKNCDKEEKNEILKLVMEKGDILGREAIKKLLFHEIGQVPFIIKSVSWGEDVDARLEILPKAIKEEIQQFTKLNAPEFIDNAIRNFKSFFKAMNEQHYKILNTFTFFLNYHGDQSQLEQFIQNITSTVDGESTRSIWAELLVNECEDHKTEDIAKMDKFMKCLSEKLGQKAVKELVLHKDDERPVIFYPALRGEEKLLETMLNYLFAKDRKKVQRQVDEFLDKTFKIPPPPTENGSTIIPYVSSKSFQINSNQSLSCHSAI